YAMSYAGDTVIRSAEVTVTGAGSDAIFGRAYAGDVSIEVTGETRSAQAAGVYAMGDMVEIAVTSDGSVSGATRGVFAYGAGDAVMALAGAASATGEGASGILAVAATGDMVLDIADVTAAGAAASGVVASATAGHVAMGLTGDVNAAGIGVT